ncbi:MAG TPA: hypothetical protein VI932_11760 [Bacteroidota bacterium]|nr:hypothetical protein [Bacteroidota bacterium]
MWDTVGSIAAVIVIILLFELLGLPDWIRKTFKEKEANGAMARKLEELESRVGSLEGKTPR